MMLGDSPSLSVVAGAKNVRMMHSRFVVLGMLTAPSGPSRSVVRSKTQTQPVSLSVSTPGGNGNWCTCYSV